jgi:hypothetical protein
MSRPLSSMYRNFFNATLLVVISIPDHGLELRERHIWALWHYLFIALLLDLLDLRLDDLSITGPSGLQSIPACFSSAGPENHKGIDRNKQAAYGRWRRSKSYSSRSARVLIFSASPSQTLFKYPIHSLCILSNQSLLSLFQEPHISVRLASGSFHPVSRI